MQEQSRIIMEIGGVGGKSNFALVTGVKWEKKNYYI